jgi:hypothetical protein
MRGISATIGRNKKSHGKETFIYHGWQSKLSGLHTLPRMSHFLAATADGARVRVAGGVARVPEPLCFSCRCGVGSAAGGFVWTGLGTEGRATGGRLVTGAEGI